MTAQHIFPSRELLQRGPLSADHRDHKFEKWCRVAQVVAEKNNQGVADFVIKGPFTIPMGFRKRNVSLGQSDKAWVFFCHPYNVFQPDGGFFNMPTKRGLLAATLVGRTEQGIVLYDEVGVNATERVATDFAGSLGGMRHRLFGINPGQAHEFYARSFLANDLNLLRAFRVVTLLLKSQNPRLLFQELDKLLRNRTVFTFLGEEFSTSELQIIRRGALASAAASQGPRSSVSGVRQTKQEQPFVIKNDDFMTADRLRDGAGRQVVGILKKRLDNFKRDHGAVLDQIELRKTEVTQEISKLEQKIAAEEARREQQGGLGRLLSGRAFNIKAAVETLGQLNNELDLLNNQIDSMPGYQAIQDLTRRFRDFNEISRSVERLATNIFDYNVGLNHIKELDALREKIATTNGDDRVKNLARYNMRLRVDILPRIMRVFSISAYVLRRPESLIGMTSGGNVGRVNRIAEKLIEYFKYMPYEGKKTFGEVFEDGWGQVRLLEARL